jgi:branched-chain amino acid transport system substrate-binding protein
MRQKWLRHLCLLAVLAVLVAACGGGGGQAEETEATGAEEDTATEEDTAAEEESPAAEGDGVLTIGTLLPQTGSLAFLGPPEFAGVDLAAQEVNEAGGVLGEDVVIIDSDSGDTTTDIASQSVDRLLSENVDAIIGAASSGVSLTVIDTITGAGVIQFSPANTAPDFTDYDDNGLYFRDAPSDVLQGSVLAEVMIEDGCTTLGIMALQDPYGEGLAGFLQESFEASGGSMATEPIIYDPQAPNFDAEVQQIAAAGPDCVAVIGFDESARVITSMIAAGIGPGSDTGVYGVDGNMGNALAEQLGDAPGALAGMKGTTPLTELSPEFQERLLEVDPNLVDFNYAAESYDAVIVLSLAAEVAGSDAGTAMAEVLPDVTREGTECTTYAECLELVQAGDDIDYNGQSGPIELSDAGDPTVASFGILQFGEDNLIDESLTEYRIAELPE